jgi:hypothetical protein
MKAILFVLFLLFIFVSVITEAQTVKTHRKRSLNLFLQWSRWELDSEKNNLGQKEIHWVRSKNRLEKNWKRVWEEIVLTYDECDHLVRKMKRRKWEGCFGGPEKIIFDRRFKSRCK